MLKKKITKLQRIKTKRKEERRKKVSIKNEVSFHQHSLQNAFILRFARGQTTRKY